MKRISFYLCLAAALLLLAACASAPEPEETKEAKEAEDTGPTIEGAWAIEEIESSGGSDEVISQSQLGLIIFTKQYYSSIRIAADEPRLLWKSLSPSEAEIVGAYKGFRADSGPYELNGSTIVFHPAVAFIPNFMSGGSSTLEYLFEGDTLWLIAKLSQLVIPGVEQGTSVPAETRYKLRRLE